MPLDVIDTVCELVRIPSVNPMGRDVSGPEFYEQALTDHLVERFSSLGLPYELQEIEPRRTNVIARLDGDPPADQGGRIVMFEAHQDTVPVDGMTIDPWCGTVREHRVYGRGACDIKGGMAAMLAAFSQLAEQRPSPRPTILMACTVNEEHGFTGASRMAQRLAAGESTLVPRSPDAVIVAEPTLLDVVVAHKGVVRWRCHAIGRAAHSCRPDHGRNAIYAMSRVLGRLEQYATQRLPAAGQHPLVGCGTLSVGLISGGISVNTVPDRCTIEIDRRLLPEEVPEEAYQDVLRDLAGAVPECPLEHEPAYLSVPGLSDANNRQLGLQVAEIGRALGGSGNLVGVAYGTDAPAFDSHGIPTVVFGPGSIDQAHTADEWIDVGQLRKAARIYYELGCRL